MFMRHFGLALVLFKISLSAAKAPQAGSVDLCFISAQPLDEWQIHLAHHGVSVEDGPVRKTVANGALMSLYIRDPDGNLIEISNYI